MNGECGPAEGRFSREQLIGSLLLMYKANENNEAVLCDNVPETRACARDFLSFFVQGGPIPGVSTFGSPYISNVGLDKESFQIKYASSSTVTWMGSPVLCQDQFTVVTVNTVNDIQIEKPSFACTWTIVPHVWTAKFAVEFIDFDNSVIAGKYSLRGGGLVTGGGGDGSFTLRLPKTRTLLAAVDGGKTVPVSLTKLPSKVLSAPVPTIEEVKSVKKEEVRDPAEVKMWEAVATENTAAGYQRYLDAYPQGRFVPTATANLAVVRDQEARAKEIELWTRIKDSGSAADFQAYLAAHPKGAFADLATVKLQRLQAVAEERQALDAELSMWEKVRVSGDRADIESYLKRYPAGQFASLARARIDKLNSAKVLTQDLEMVMWNEIKSSRDIEDYRRYLQSFPNGLFAEVASGRIAGLSSAAEQSAEIAFWGQIKSSTMASDFEAYLKRYPDGQFASLARQLVSQLKAAAIEQAEVTMWNGIQGSQRASDFNAYLQRYPQGRFAELARIRAAELDQAASLKGIDFGRYYALVIGINHYPQLINLETAVADAKAVAQLLKTDYGFSVITLIDADRKGVIDALSQYRRTLKENDNLLIYYAGHGYLDPDSNRGYWLPSDAERDSPANWISTSDITDNLKAIRAKHVIVVADSCYSGTLARDVKIGLRGPDYLRRMVEKRARVALTSGGLEPVLDSGGGGHSVFASAFMTVLRENRSVLEGTRLFNELRRPVVTGAPQTPEYGNIRFAGHDGGDFLFVRR